MTRYVIRRLLWACVLFIAVTMVTYIIFFIVPANPALELCGKACTEEDIQRVERYWGLDQPVPVQYGKFVERMLPITWSSAEGHPIFQTPSLGRSFATRREVSQVVLDAAPVTASLVFGGAILWMLIALPLGILSALRPRSFLDRTSMVFVLIGISAHPVWIGYIFLFFFGFKLGWFPIGTYCDFINPSTTCGGPVQWFWHMILPWATFALLFAATYTRMTRATVMETMNEDYVRTARAKGAPERTVMRSHILRNAMLPVVTMLGMDIGLALGGAVFTETVYALPGLGRTAISALETFDLPTLMGVVVFATICIIVFNLIVDLLYAVIDPRIRLA